MDRFVLTVLSAGVLAAAAGCNSAPRPLDDSTSLTEGSAVAIPVLANDFDPDGDPMIVARVWGAQKGSVSINPDNTVMYAPAPGAIGVDTFQYRVKDNRGHAKTATVAVAIEPPRERVILAAPEPVVVPAPQTYVVKPGRTVQSVLVTLHTTADDKNRDEPVRMVVRRENLVLADATVGVGELWGTMTDRSVELILQPPVPAAAVDELSLDLIKGISGAGTGGGWTVWVEAEGRLSDGSKVVLLAPTRPLKLGDGAPAQVSWSLPKLP
jgi:hypothetical protein